MPDHFETQQTMLNSPADDFQPVTPSDTTDLPGGVCRALLVGSGGDAELHNKSGQLRSAIPLVTGINPIRVKRVLATGTAATGIVALY